MRHLFSKFAFFPSPSCLKLNCQLVFVSLAGTVNNQNMTCCDGQFYSTDVKKKEGGKSLACPLKSGIQF